MAQATVRQHCDNIKFMTNPYLTNGNALKCQFFVWFWLTWRRIIAPPGALASYFMHRRDNFERAGAGEV
jgi:hypothetical protein